MRCLVLLGILLASSEVRAECGFPQWVGTASGTHIPLEGSLYLYNEAQELAASGYYGVSVEWEGSQIGNSRLVPIAENVSRLDYEGPKDSTLKITLGHKTYDYYLRDDWAAPGRAPRVMQTWHNVHSWTCSWADSLMLQLDQHTAAVRARWTFEGKPSQWIIPARAEETKAVVELGKVNCGGTTLPPEELLYGGKLELFAIRFDGSEVPVERVPKSIKTADIPDDERGVAHAMTIVTLDKPDAVEPPREQRGRWPAFVAFGLLLLAVAIAFRTKDQRVIVRGHGDDLG